MADCRYCKNGIVHFIEDYNGIETPAYERKIRVFTGTSGMAICVPIEKAKYCPMCGRKMERDGE
jgi:hypothetical protein